mmetsp:Transcript_23075/g.32963  ORF Transcript_23075/g.32963 Transcript_23075/m.32963 type:complete len:275 (+) Transcript_23075:76-900(+)
MNNNKYATKRLLISIFLALASCAGGAKAFSTPLRHNRIDYTSKRGPTQPSSKTPWQVPRGGDLTTSSTSLKSSLIGAIDVFYKTMPLTSAFVTCGIKASAADLVAQKRAASLDETDEEIEKRRNFAFFLYGGLYQGMAQEILFNEIFPKIFGQGTDIITVISKVSFDMLVVSPFVCLPVAYLVKSVIFQYSVGEALARYKDDVMKNGLLLKYWSLWGPVQCLTFGVVPVHLRIAFIAVISFFWLIIFSSVSAKGQRERELECSLEDGVSCRIDG